MRHQRASYLDAHTNRARRKKLFGWSKKEKIGQQSLVFCMLEIEFAPTPEWMLQPCGWHKPSSNAKRPCALAA